jgi:hypothetical protein
LAHGRLCIPAEFPGIPAGLLFLQIFSRNYIPAKHRNDTFSTLYVEKWNKITLRNRVNAFTFWPTLGCAFLQKSQEFLQDRCSCKYFAGITFLENTGTTEMVCRCT